MRKLTKIPAFDGVRGLGVLLVIFTHFPLVVESEIYNSIWHANQISRVAYTLLDLFFAISGFFITRMLLIEREQTGKIAFPMFYMRRAFRIFPIYYIAVVTCFFVFSFKLPETASLLTYTFNIYHPFNPAPQPLEQAWSLSVEEQFYLIWPLLIALTPTRFVSLMVGRIVPAAAILCGIGLAILARGSDPMFSGDIIYMSPVTRMLSLSLGGWIAVREVENRPFLGWPCLVLVASATVLLMVDRFGRNSGVITSQAAYWVLALASYAMISVAIVSTIVFDTRWAGKCLRGLFTLRPLMAIGRLSYALYLFHLPVLFYLGLNDAALHGAKAPIAKVALCLAVTFCLAILSYFAIERPMLSLRPGGDWFGGRAKLDWGRLILGLFGDNGQPGPAEPEASELGIRPVTSALERTS
jgi:peptidoglycan/LPS O-acetylase OafA/YrhL